jgi:16S rRNA (guanine527-N7)-methyltransferase
MTLLNSALTQNLYDFKADIQQQFSDYLALLQRWNEVFNLTAIRDPDEMVWLHILDSLSINTFLQGKRIIDVGTGGGLPGIPLAIINPDKQFTLLDSNGKKTRFLTQAKMELGLKNIEVVQSRCELYNPTEKFDLIVSRAFSSIRLMLETTQHLAQNSGQFVAMKGIYPEEELKDIPANFGWKVQPLTIKGLAAERHVVFIERIKEEV